MRCFGHAHALRPPDDQDASAAGNRPRSVLYVVPGDADVQVAARRPLITHVGPHLRYVLLPGELSARLGLMDADQVLAIPQEPHPPGRADVKPRWISAASVAFRLLPGCGQGGLSTASKVLSSG